MTDKQVETYIAVVEHGSFLQAAKALYVSPQAVAQQVTSIERQVGARLLTRTRNGVNPTKAGLLLYKGFRQLQSDYEKLLKHVAQENTQERSIRIGIFPYSKMFTEAAKSFGTMHPEFSLQFIAVDSEDWIDHLNKVKDKQLDMMEFASRQIAEEQGLAFLPMLRSPCVALVSANHPLAGRQTVQLKELAGGAMAVHAEKCVQGLADAAQQAGIKLIAAPGGRQDAYDICTKGGAFLLADIYVPYYEPLVALKIEEEFWWVFGCAYRQNEEPHIRKFIHSFAQAVNGE